MRQRRQIDYTATAWRAPNGTDWIVRCDQHPTVRIHAAETGTAMVTALRQAIATHTGHDAASIDLVIAFEPDTPTTDPPDPEPWPEQS